jgi:MoaA/NifB/PqqE/SkfB family radical SAM enzyme
MIDQVLESLRAQHRVIAVVDLSAWTDNYDTSKEWLIQQCRDLYQPAYDNDQRIVFVHTKDYYVNDRTSGLILRNLQVVLNETDISTFFVTVVSTSPTIAEEMAKLQSINNDLVALSYTPVQGEFQRIILDKFPINRKEEYQYGSANPIKISLNDLNEREQFLLTESKVFCMYPWIHLHAWPTGQAFPCCYSDPEGQLGDCRKSSLAEIWNSEETQQLRRNMLTEQPSSACKKCYEMEQAGFFSGRQSANKHHGHHVNYIAETADTGRFDKFEMSYWDIRFSNLCNLSCRSCGHIFSSSWFQDQAALVGDDWKAKNKPLNYSGRWETDMWEQLIPHLDYVEQIYFAGGEPLLMEEHYNILEELVKRERFDVRLIYNTNFTHTQLKDRSVFEYWKLFKSVAVGASLDAMGAHAEYIRKGTRWDQVVRNREEMIKVCPEVDFYISPTLSIMNALHLPDFHRRWVDQQLINPQDVNVNILQDPVHYRIDIAPAEYKKQIQSKFEQHLEWLRPQDRLRRATVGYESAINFMNAQDNTHVLPAFWAKTQKLDDLRNENILEIIPELAALK